MKTLLKLALAGTALAAAAAHADVVLPTAPNGGDLLLFVQDTAVPNTTYARDIGISLDSIFSTGSIVSSASYTGPVTLTTANFSVGADANLQAFLSAHSADLAAGKIQWAVEAGAYNPSNPPSGQVAPGKERFITTTAQDISAVTAVNTASITGKYTKLLQDSQAINNFGGAGLTQIGAGNTSTAAGGDGAWGTSNGVSGNQNWYGGGPVTSGTFASSTASTSQQLYGLTGNGTGKPAQVYQFGSIFFDADGTLHISAVPIPAALWLFGSGLLGLVGLGRRRSEAVAA